MVKSYFVLLTLSVCTLCSCGTIYIPQILPEARGVGRSVGQEDISVKIIPVTANSLIPANKHPYIRRVIDASDLNQPAKLVSVEDAIAQKLPPSEISKPYRLGVGDELLITQSEFFSTQFINQKDNLNSSRRSINSRTLQVADDGFVSIVGIGRLQLEGLTQFEAEELIYQTLVQNEKNAEFELKISAFKSQKIYMSGYDNELAGSVSYSFANSLEGEDKFPYSASQFIMVPFTNIDLYLHQLIIFLQPKIRKGEDFLLVLKRDDNLYRMSLTKVLTGEIENIRILAEDRVFVERLPYRPETALLTGEVKQDKLITISASQRQSLAEALYASGGSIIKGNSDTSQIFVIRELGNQNIVAYHLDSSNPARLTLAARFELRPNDIIYVAPQFVTNYNRALSQILLTAVNTTALAN